MDQPAFEVESQKYVDIRLDELSAKPDTARRK
jgi:hypothetical protein